MQWEQSLRFFYNHEKNICSLNCFITLSMYFFSCKKLTFWSHSAYILYWLSQNHRFFPDFKKAYILFPLVRFFSWLFKKHMFCSHWSYSRSFSQLLNNHRFCSHCEEIFSRLFKKHIFPVKPRYCHYVLVHCRPSWICSGSGCQPRQFL